VHPAVIAAVASSGAGWRPNMATSATLRGWYEIRDDLVTRVTGDASNVVNRVAGGADPLVQGNSLNRPTYEATGWGGARASLVFDGIADVMTANGLAAYVTGTDQPFTVVFLGQLLTLGSVGSIRNIWGFGSTTDDSPQHDLRLPASTTGVQASSRRDTADVSAIKDAATALTTNRAMRSLVFTGTRVALYTDGALDANLDGVHATNANSDVGVLTGLDTFTVGGITRTVTSGCIDIRLAALLVFQGAISGAELAKAEHYLEIGHPL
jgi:hypothetical protein